MENTTTSLLKKLAEFKQEEINIPKDTQAYGYKYSPLDTILPVIEPLLYKHGLWYFHQTDFDKKSWKNYLVTTIYEIETTPVINETTDIAINVQGYIQSRILIDEEVTLAKMNKYMVLGSALTYFRRYHLVVMLGLLTDEDTDGGSLSGGRSVESSQREIDYLKTFKGLIENKQSKQQIHSFYKKYKKNFSEQQELDISALIKKSFKK